MLNYQYLDLVRILCNLWQMVIVKGCWMVQIRRDRCLNYRLPQEPDFKWFTKVQSWGKDSSLLRIFIQPQNSEMMSTLQRNRQLKCVECFTNDASLLNDSRKHCLKVNWRVNSDTEMSSGCFDGCNWWWWRLFYVW